MMIAVILGECGLKVRCLPEGKAEEAHRIAKKSDIILMDVMLPGLSGIDLGKPTHSYHHDQRPGRRRGVVQNL